MWLFCIKAPFSSKKWGKPANLVQKIFQKLFYK